MTVTHRKGSVLTSLRPYGSAAHMNLAAAVRARRLGTRGWQGAVNTAYDPLDPATASDPFAAYRALHSGGRLQREEGNVDRFPARRRSRGPSGHRQDPQQ